MMEMMKHDMMKWRIWPVCLSRIAILYWNDPLKESSILASALQATRSGASLQQCYGNVITLKYSRCHWQWERSWQILEHDARPCQRQCHDAVLKHTVGAPKWEEEVVEEAENVRSGCKQVFFKGFLVSIIFRSWSFENNLGACNSEN